MEVFREDVVTGHRASSYDCQIIKECQIRSPDFRYNKPTQSPALRNNPFWAQEPKLGDLAYLLDSIKACGKHKDICRGSWIHDYILKTGLLQKHIYINNALISMYVKCGALKKAQEVFNDLLVRNDVSWNVLIAAYVHCSLNDQALELFGRMQEEGFFPDAITFTCILKACGNLKLAMMGQSIHVKVYTQGLLRKNVVLGTALVGMYAKCGMLIKAQEVFDKLPARDVVSWNALIDGYVQKGLIDEAIICLKHMQEDGFAPDSVSFACILKGCSAMKGEEIHAKACKERLLGKDPLLGNAIIYMYVRCGRLLKAREVFDELPVRNAVSWNLLIDGYVQHGHNAEAMICCNEMQENGLLPDAITFSCILKACGSLGLAGKGEEIHAEINKQGLLKDNMMLGTSLVDMYAKCGMLGKAKEVFDKLPKRDVISWTALISGYSQQGLGHEALHFFQRMQDEGVSPDAITFTCILEACGSIGSIDIGEEVHVEIQKQGLLPKNMVLCTALVDMYAKCGALTKAQDVFDEILTHDVVSWNAMISGYAQLGKVKEVISLFNRMVAEGITVNSITFGALLTMCNHAGLVEEGELYLDMINSVYFIQPTLQLYICIVDLFCRSGNFGKAMVIIEMVPILSRRQMWVAFLVACRTWANVELGEMAFEHLVRLDERYSGGYVCMSNIYAAASMQESDYCE